MFEQVSSKIDRRNLSVFLSKNYPPYQGGIKGGLNQTTTPKQLFQKITLTFPKNQKMSADILVEGGKNPLRERAERSETSEAHGWTRSGRGS